MKLSIVIPFTADETEPLAATLSAIHPVTANIEVICVNYGLIAIPDGSGSVCSTPYRLIRNKTLVLYSAVQTGLDASTGDMLAWIWPGDQYSVDGLRNIMKQVSDNKISLIVGATEVLNAQGVCIEKRPFGLDPMVDVLRWFDVWFPSCSVFFSRELWQSCRPFNPAFSMAADFDLWLRMFRQTKPAIWPETICRTTESAAKYPDANVVYRNEVLWALARYCDDIAVFTDQETASRFNFRWHDLLQIETPAQVDRSSQLTHTLALMTRALVRRQWEALSPNEPIALFGAGQHTVWLLNCIKDIKRPRIACILDQKMKNGAIGNVPVVCPKKGDPPPTRVIVLSSDTFQDQMAENIKSFYGDKVQCIDLYSELPREGYPKLA